MGISRYKASDAAALAAIYIRIYPDHPRRSAGFQRRLQQLLEAGGRAWVLRKQGTVVAFASISPVPGLDRVWEGQGFVDPKRQREGLGSQLLRHLITYLKHHNASQLSCRLTAKDGAAATFLRARGFFVEHEEQIMRLSDLSHLPSSGSPEPDIHSLPQAAAIRTFCALYSQSFAGFPWHQPYSPDEVEESLADLADLLFLLEAGQPIGFAWIRQSSPVKGEIEPIGVAKAHQGQGHGRALLREGLARLRERGVTQVKIGAWRSNQIAIHLYEQFGFKTVQCLTYLAYDLQERNAAEKLITLS